MSVERLLSINPSYICAEEEEEIQRWSRACSQQRPPTSAPEASPIIFSASLTLLRVASSSSALALNSLSVMAASPALVAICAIGPPMWCVLFAVPSSQGPV